MRRPTRAGALAAFALAAPAALSAEGPAQAEFAGVWSDAGERHRLVLIAPAGTGADGQALLYGELADGRRYVVAATRVGRDGADLTLDLPAMAAHRRGATDNDALAGHRVELPPAGAGPGPSRWRGTAAAGGLELRCKAGCDGLPALLHLRRASAPR